MKKAIDLVKRLRASAWASLGMKALGGAMVLTLLALFGAGVGDKFFDPGTAHAARDPSARKHGASKAERPPFERDASEKGSVNEAASTSEPLPSATASPLAVASVGASASASAGSSSRSGPTGVLPDGRVVLNEATAEQIDKLPGIGLKKAESIVALRTKLGGRFKRLEDLTRVKGIKRRAIEKLRPHVVLDAPSTP